MKPGDEVIVNHRLLPANTAAKVDMLYPEASMLTVKLHDGRVFAVSYAEVAGLVRK